MRSGFLRTACCESLRGDQTPLASVRANEYMAPGRSAERTLADLARICGGASGTMALVAEFEGGGVGYVGHGEREKRFRAGAGVHIGRARSSSPEDLDEKYFPAIPRA